MAIRDVSRALGHPYSTGDRISKMIMARPGKKITIKKAMEENPDLKSAYDSEPDARRILDLATKLTGVARHASTHAAGVVISDEPMVHYTPLQKETKRGEGVCTQYDMYALDLNVSDNALGLLKMDFLGLRNLTTLEKAREFVKATRGIEVDISEIPLDDPKVYKMLSKGETTGVFQMESQGMRRAVKKLKPEKFGDISAMVALYRPGPMQFIDEYINGKHNPRAIRYPHPDLEPILAETYGIAVYQEQVMEIPLVMAGYTLGEGDILRRAIGKKKIELMNKEGKRFTERALKRKYKKEVIENVWSLIERFAGYGFNKAHSVSYAMIAYQTAWMKVNYPVQFMAALLSAEAASGSQQAKEIKIPMAIAECQKMKIKVLTPDINLSYTGFTLEKDKDSLGGLAIRFGFSAIKNVGGAAMEEILEVREKGGDFSSLSDFCQRTSPQKINKKVLESLIKAGALDNFGTRASMISSLDRIREVAEAEHKRKTDGQGSLFAANNPETSFTINLPEVEEFPLEEILEFEKQLFGFFLTADPAQKELSKFMGLSTHKLDQVEEEVGNKVRVVGMITNIRTTLTKAKQEEMAFITIRDDLGQVDVVIFPQTYSDCQSYLNHNSIILVEGRVDRRRGLNNEDQISLVAEVACHPAKFEDNESQLVVKIPSGLKANTLVRLNKLLKNNPGKTDCLLIFPNGKKMKVKGGVKRTSDLEKTIRMIIHASANGF